MTARDLMPFGKYKGLPLSDVPDSYRRWLLEQPGFADKNPALARFFRNPADPANTSAIEVRNLSDEADLRKTCPPDFLRWWAVAYGERLRRDGEIAYIPYMRVALAAWTARAKLDGQVDPAAVLPVGKPIQPPPDIYDDATPDDEF